MLWFFSIISIPHNTLTPLPIVFSPYNPIPPTITSLSHLFNFRLTLTTHFRLKSPIIKKWALMNRYLVALLSNYQRPSHAAA